MATTADTAPRTISIRVGAHRTAPADGPTAKQAVKMAAYAADCYRRAEAIFADLDVSDELAERGFRLQEQAFQAENDLTRYGYDRATGRRA